MRSYLLASCSAIQKTPMNLCRTLSTPDLTLSHIVLYFSRRIRQRRILTKLPKKKVLVFFSIRIRRKEKIPVGVVNRYLPEYNRLVKMRPLSRNHMTNLLTSSFFFSRFSCYSIVILPEAHNFSQSLEYYLKSEKRYENETLFPSDSYYHCDSSVLFLLCT